MFFILLIIIRFKMKHLLIILFSLSAIATSNAQNTSFENTSDVIMYMENKTFYNSDYDLTIEYGFIPSYVTYGIVLINNGGAKSQFINVDITCYGSFADLYGMSPIDGSNFGFRLYIGKLIVGRGEPGETTFYLKY